VPRNDYRHLTIVDEQNYRLHADARPVRHVSIRSQPQGANLRRARKINKQFGRLDFVWKPVVKTTYKTQTNKRTNGQTPGIEFGAF